jgi:hypothetical protein
MSGVDFMTIAKWCSHADGGMLIGKVYGHLSNEHAQRAASKVTFGSGAREVKPEPSTDICPDDLSIEQLVELLRQKTTKK